MPLISRVRIENYKSIEILDFEARRVTVFIGGPNAGKSNILETLAFLSPGFGDESVFSQIFRVRQAAELFRDQAIDLHPKLSMNQKVWWEIMFERDHGRFRVDFNFQVGQSPRATAQFPAQAPGQNWHQYKLSPIRFYTYRRDRFANGSSTEYGALSAPFGENLPALLFSDKGFRESVSGLFKAHGHRLELRPQAAEILISKVVDDVLYSYSFDSISETLRRIVFYKAILETNQNAVLVLDEPEANTFPFYTKYLAERIALDESNQFFLTTHNPYVLMSIIEKTPKTDLAVYATRMHNYRTDLHLLNEAELAEALDLGMDLFLNLDRYFPE